MLYHDHHRNTTTPGKKKKLSGCLPQDCCSEVVQHKGVT